MTFQRRRLLQILSYALGSSVIPLLNQFAIALQTPAPPASPVAPADAVAKHELGKTKWKR